MAAATGLLRVRTPEEVRDIVNKYVKALKQKIHVSKVILFGSYARGAPRAESDIDLAIISPDFGQDEESDWFLLSYTRREADYMIEAVPYSVEQYENYEKGTFLHEIIRTGVVVYDGDEQGEDGEVKVNLPPIQTLDEKPSHVAE